MRCDPVSLPPGDAAAAAHGWGGWGLGMFRGLRENPILLQSQRKESKPFLSDSWNLSRKNNNLNQSNLLFRFLNLSLLVSFYSKQ
ncbi:Os12g0639000 [Oryza sativa Japonica Group]|uniref:Expressed protein n=2 Tax=Oryza sativa subsp. japonica TaxID=39947 RepID=Q0ILL1_ORYSJ|nr:expressed protein [Oryza sativa Japonica Group]KAB8118382.1 hypothetical protein EE612_061170 [Oryza sativa]BAF30404.1 Os12g0639000 [Oryza sativa Japonica Group]BAT18283.1 Os12g0639000 [Oryza sativa Japonica Group]|eukprot:NP_001067385.1 Os12g0639000 [Oryza sativa Japonica Group]